MLAFEETGKYISERHAAAAAEGKLTAGQMAAKLNREFKPAAKIKAAELKLFAAEWHHSGFYKGSRGSTMGRTYFFAANTDLTALYARVCEARVEAAQVAAEPDVERYFFSCEFRRESGRYGRKFYVPIAKFEAITCKPGEFIGSKKTEISKEDFEALKQFAGHDLESYESLGHFKSRKLTVQNVA